MLQNLTTREPDREQLAVAIASLEAVLSVETPGSDAAVRADRDRRLGAGQAMAPTLEADYLVVGAGASGMAFADALTGHADVQVALVDRRHAPGGHWLDAYPFVRLHQASSFYGVASTLLGSGSIQSEGPEAGPARTSRRRRRSAPTTSGC